ncbi:hypothetical protein [Muribacter muris]|nr:hypothetical protein [Muribacter muris]
MSKNPEKIDEILPKIIGAGYGRSLLELKKIIYNNLIFLHSDSARGNDE